VALEHLVGTLAREAEAEAAAILAAARADADAITARSEQVCAASRESARATREAEQRAAVESALAEARRIARGEMLEARRRVLDRVFGAARAALPAAVERPEYRAGVAQELEIALRCVGDRPATLRCHPVLQAVIEPLLRARASVTLVVDPAAGSGFRVVTRDGSLEVDATLEDRLARLAPRLAIEVAAQLDGAR
jgi:vacuolar-type H+-ATPase subunit E/Vma4